YTKYRKKLNFREWVFQKAPFSWIGIFAQIPVLIALFPVFVYGFINHILPALLPLYLSKKMKDYQFWSSVRSTMTLFTFPMFYLLQFLVVLWIVSDFRFSLIYLATLPISGIIAYHYSIWFKKLRAKLRYNILKIRKNRVLNEAIKQREELIKIVNKWFIKDNEIFSESGD
ncbi:MAG: hypothetical protein ACQESJ_02055, partial [Bacteroidota bacterium]